MGEHPQLYLLVGKQNVVRIDPSESENPIGLHDVERAVTELSRLARSHAEATGALHQPDLAR
jgi:hypothetical protein